MRKDVENELLKYGEEVNILNKSELARRLNCSRQTISNKLKRKDNPPGKRIYESKLDEYDELIKTKIERYACTAMSIYSLLKDKYGYTGSYSLVAKKVSKYKQEQKVKVTIRYETTPGYQSQVDWKEKVVIADKQGGRYTINIFLMILGYSRMKFIKLTFDRTQKTLFECIAAGFDYFKRTTEEILFDNMKTVVDHTKSDFYNVVINDNMLKYSKDAGFTIKTCRAFRPETKGKVEILAKITNRLKAYNNEFNNVKELEKIIQNMNKQINQEIVQGINERPIERYNKKEKNTLKPVNIELLKKYFSNKKEYKVSKESMITYKGKKYSVPTAYIGKYVTVKEDDFEIYIYYSTNYICSYNKKEEIYLNYKEEHYKEILLKSAYQDKSEEEIEKIMKRNLDNMDKILIDKE